MRCAIAEGCDRDLLVPLLAGSGIAWFTTLEFPLATFIRVVALGLRTFVGVSTILVVFRCPILTSNGYVLGRFRALLVRAEILALTVTL